MRHDPRDYLTAILGMIRKPFKYKVQPLNGPGSEGALFVEGERYNIQRLYRVQPFDPSTLPPRIYSPDVPFDPFSMSNLMMASGGWGVMNTGFSAARPATRPGDRSQPGPDGDPDPATRRHAQGISLTVPTQPHDDCPDARRAA